MPLVNFSDNLLGQCRILLQLGKLFNTWINTVAKEFHRELFLDFFLFLIFALTCFEQEFDREKWPDVI